MERCAGSRDGDRGEPFPTSVLTKGRSFHGLQGDETHRVETEDVTRSLCHKPQCSEVQALKSSKGLPEGRSQQWNGSNACRHREARSGIRCDL